MRRGNHWRNGSGEYTAFGIERPFPWVGVAIWSLPIIGAAAAIGGILAVLIFGGESLADHLIDW